jgi:hypothetical protein
MHKIILIIVAISLIAVFFLFNITGLLVFPDTPTTTNYCGDGECDDNEDCGGCATDCGLCRLRVGDVTVALEWRDFYKSDNATDLCGEYDKGSVYGMIKLSDEMRTGVYFCTVNFTDAPQKSFSVRSPGRWELFAAGMSLKQDQTGKFCCHSYSADPDFCETIILSAYC